MSQVEKTIKAVLYPTTYLDTTGNKYPVFRVVKDLNIWTNIHPCLNSLHIPHLNMTITTFDKETLSSLFSTNEVIYFVKLDPNKDWVVFSEKQFNNLGFAMGYIWDFEENNAFNEVFRKEKGEVYQEGFIKSSLFYQFETGHKFDVFDHYCVPLLKKVNNSTFNETLFKELNSFLLNLAVPSHLKRPLYDFINVTFVGEGTTVIRDAFMGNGPGLTIYQHKTGVSYMKINSLFYRVAVKDQSEDSKYYYRFYELKSTSDLDAFFNLYDFLVDTQTTV